MHPTPSGTPSPYRLVATDLDGTLLREDGSLSDYTRTVLAELALRHVRHIVVTGRPASGCRDLFRRIGYADLAVCGQGAQLYDARTDRLIVTRELDRPLARWATTRLMTHLPGCTFAVLTAGTAGRLVLATGFRRPGELAGYVPQDWSRLWDEPIEKVLVRHPDLDDDRLADAVSRICDPHLEGLHTGQGQIELVPRGVDKAVGLATAAELLGVHPREVIAFGDMPNDIPMLRWSGHGVAMGNAHPTLKAVAAEVAPSNAEDGVAQVLHRTFVLPGSCGQAPCPATQTTHRRAGMT